MAGIGSSVSGRLTPLRSFNSPPTSTLASAVSSLTPKEGTQAHTLAVIDQQAVLLLHRRKHFGTCGIRMIEVSFGPAISTRRTSFTRWPSSSIRLPPGIVPSRIFHWSPAGRPECRWAVRASSSNALCALCRMHLGKHGVRGIVKLILIAGTRRQPASNSARMHLRRMKRRGPAMARILVLRRRLMESKGNRLGVVGACSPVSI